VTSQEANTKNDHHMPLKETPHMKIFCLRHCYCRTMTLAH